MTKQSVNQKLILMRIEYYGGVILFALSPGMSRFQFMLFASVSSVVWFEFLTCFNYVQFFSFLKFCSYRDRKKAQAKHQHIGALGRIIKSVKVETGDGKHPFIYDIDLVLGGKIHGMERDELAYTTADVEGMTGESRARRKRKPSTTAAEDFEGANGTAKKGPTKTTKSKTGPAASKSKAGTTKKQKKSTTTAGTGKSSSNTAAKAGKKRANDGKTTNSTAKKAKTTKKSTTTTEDTEPSSTATGNTTMELYERHRREFERSLVRLEKNDTYQYFLGDVPEEFEETYQETGSTSDNNDANVGEATSSITHHNDSNSASFVSATTNAQHNATDSLASLPAVPKNSIGEGKGKKSRIGSNGYPDHPPYNFVVIRQRMERGRYVIDLQAREEEERFQRLAPYFKSLNKRLSRKIRRKNNVPKKTTDKKGRPFVFLDKMNILHPTAVNWELFRRDVIGMCDAAVERHPELNSLGSAARRIKETMEQIYEKTGKRHIGEMSVDNDRHRFNDAMESFDNIEPAMQGKWRKTGMFGWCGTRDVLMISDAELTRIVCCPSVYISSFLSVSQSISTAHVRETEIRCRLRGTIGTRRADCDLRTVHEPERQLSWTCVYLR